MGLFIVRHRHEPERCPATDPYMGAMLLNRPNVRHHGVNIQGEAVVQGEHTLYMIIESSDEDRVRAFMRPFAEAGTVDVFPASTCVRVVASGGCAASMPVVDEPVPALDPEEACQHAIDAGLVVHRSASAELRDVDPRADGGCRDAQRAFLRAQPLSDPDARPVDLAARGWRSCRSAVEPEPARPRKQYGNNSIPEVPVQVR